MKLQCAKWAVKSAWRLDLAFPFPPFPIAIPFEMRGDGPNRWGRKAEILTAKNLALDVHYILFPLLRGESNAKISNNKSLDRTPQTYWKRGGDPRLPCRQPRHPIVSFSRLYWRWW